MIRRQATETLKELIRHFAMKAGMPGFLDNYRSYKGVKTDHLFRNTIKNRFHHIYSSHAWIGSENQQSLSGPGSDVSSTTNIRSFLPFLVELLKARNLVDVGCGDWTWMKSIHLPCEYLGIDIVDDVINSNLVFSGDNIGFKCMNAIEEAIPFADIVMCREILFHLSLKDSLLLLKNIKSSSKYVLATTNDLWFNSDIRSGDFRNINLRRPPFCFPAPIISFSDSSISPGRSMSIWESSSLPL